MMAKMKAVTYQIESATASERGTKSERASLGRVWVRPRAQRLRSSRITRLPFLVSAAELVAVLYHIPVSLSSFV